MSAVVLRCPNCGTTRTTPGECEACHAAQVRYFCTTHTPGRWLETPACPQCGARFGEPERQAPAPLPSSIPSPSSPSASPSVPSPASAAPRRAPSPAPSSAAAPSSTAAPASPPRRSTASGSGGAIPSRKRPSLADDDASGPRHEFPTRMPVLQALLLAATRARRMRPTARPELEAVPIARGLGCLMRFILIVVVLLLALVSAVFVFGGALLQMFLPY